jgi:predicted MFS family arabinose efflux permease
MVALTIPGIFVPVLAGIVADRYGYTYVFPAAILFEIIAFFVIWRFLRESRPQKVEEDGWRSMVKFLQRAWLPPRDLRGLFIASALDMFAWAMGFGLLYGLLAKEYGFTTTQLGILAAVTNLTWAVSSMPIGRLIDRIGAKPIMAFSEALGVPVMLIWITQSQFEVLVASMILFAITAATWVPSRNTYVTQVVAPARRGEIFGRLSAFSSLFGFPSAFLGGWLYDHHGFAAPLLGNMIFAALSCAVIVFFVPPPRAKTQLVAAPAE